MANLLSKTVDIFMSEHFCVYRNIAAVVGMVILLNKFLSFLFTARGLLHAYFLAPWGIMRTDLKKYGSWAVVTGSSEGIGKGYALELARRGMNVVLMSWAKEQLEKVAEEIKEKYSRDVRIIVVDFLLGQEVYENIRYELNGLDIGVLVNNVGMCYEYPEFTIDVPAQRLRQIIELNCQTMVQMTHLVLPNMIKRKGGVVINIASFAGSSPLPLLGVYSASKVFVNYFSAALRKEYSSKGITVQNITPFLVATALSTITRTSYIVPSPSTFARAAVATVGQMDSTPGYFPHALQMLFYTSLPAFLHDRILWSKLVAKRNRVLQNNGQQKKDD